MILRALAVLLCLTAAARADSWTRPPLGRYEARTIVTGTDRRSRPAGLAACLADVLAKVSGDPSVLADPRLANLDPALLLVDFDYVDRMGGLPHHDEQGSSDRPFWLTARFDPTKLDAALRRLDRTPFAGDRPVVLPLIGVLAPGSQFLVDDTAPHGRDHRAALAAAADRVGLRLRLPSAAEAAAGLRPGEGVALLHGSLDWSDAAHGWVADWDMPGGHHWQVRGVSFDAAYRVGLRGALAVFAGLDPQAAPATETVAAPNATR